MAAPILVKASVFFSLLNDSWLLRNATAYAWDWYCHLVSDRARLTCWVTITKRFTLTTVLEVGVFYLQKDNYKERVLVQNKLNLLLKIILNTT
jgi:hypothetical protein